MKLIKVTTALAALSLGLFSLASCGGAEKGNLNLDDPSNPEQPEEKPDKYQRVSYTYNLQHPCVMWTQADFDRVSKSIAEGTAPQAVKDELEALKASAYASKGYQPSATVEIVRGDPKGTTTGSENYGASMRDAAAAYQLALLWKVTGDDDYAAAGVRVLNAWATTCKRVTSNDSNHKLTAAQGYTFAMAAEILSSYKGWSAADLAAFKAWTMAIWAPLSRDFLDRHQGTCDDHYWSNWDLVNMCCYLAVGILNDDNAIINYVVNYFYDGTDNRVKGNGCISKLIQAVHDDPLGSGEKIAQNQESGRDQGHAQMSAAVSAQFAQMGYALYTLNSDKKELDFFAANDNALLKMGEYVALSNLRQGNDQANKAGSWLIDNTRIPFQTYYYCGGAKGEGPKCSCNSGHGATHTEVTNDGGRGSLRPGWEIYVMHYSKVKGMTSGYKYAKMAADKMRPEHGSGDIPRYGSNSGAFDQTGWNTLMMYRE